MSEKTGTSTMAIWSMKRCCDSCTCLMSMLGIALTISSTIGHHYIDVCKEPHLSSTHGVSMKGDIIEIYLAGLRGETVFRDALQLRLDADGLALPTIYTYLNDLCGLVHYLNACFIDGHMKSSGNRVYRLVSCPEFTSHPFVKYWTNGNKSHCLHALFCADD